jgi:hypothetical protein
MEQYKISKKEQTHHTKKRKEKNEANNFKTDELSTLHQCHPLKKSKYRKAETNE